MTEDVVCRWGNKAEVYHELDYIDDAPVPACEQQQRRGPGKWRKIPREMAEPRLRPCKNCYSKSTTVDVDRDDVRDILGVTELPDDVYRDEDALVTLMAANVRVPSLADTIGVGPAAIYRQLRKYDIDPPHPEYSQRKRESKKLRDALERADPDEIGRPTPEGDESWRGYYAEGEKGQ